MRELTIGILVCDKDVHLLFDLLRRIEKRVHIPHEVIVWDNTERETLPPMKSGECKVLRKNALFRKENVRQFFGRRRIALAASGDYIWFIDADDDFMEVDSTFIPSEYADAVIFPYRTPSGLKAMAKKAGFYRYSYMSGDEWMKAFCGGLWNKWFAASALREAYSLAPCDARISIMEDTIAIMLFLRKERIAAFKDKAIYKYNDALSLGGSAVIDSTEKMMRYTAGMRAAIDAVNSVYTQREQAVLLGGHAFNFGEYITDMVCDRITQSALCNSGMASPLALVAAREIGAYEAVAGMARARHLVPLERLAEWAETEREIRDALGVTDVFMEGGVYPYYGYGVCMAKSPYCTSGRGESNPRLQLGRLR